MNFGWFPGITKRSHSLWWTDSVSIHTMLKEVDYISCTKAVDMRLGGKTSLKTYCVQYHCQWQIFSTLPKNTEDIQRYVVGYEIYFTSETGFFFFFTSAKHEWKYIKKILSHKWNKFHIQLENVEFSVYYIFLHEASNFKLPAPKQY